jgi:hypothetical protein
MVGPLDRATQEICMRKFVVEAFELHAQKYRVEAETPAEAILHFYRGDGEEIGPSELIEMSMDHGLLVDADRDLVDCLTAFGEKVDFDVVAGIRDVTEVGDDEIP